MSAAYRPEPTAGEPRAPLLWRPWMSRMATVLVVAASPAPVVCARVMASRAWPGTSHMPEWAFFGVVILGIHVLASVAFMSAAAIDGALTPSLAIRISWAWVIYPCIGIARLAKWVAYGVGAP